jgi:hypothetical protein
MPKNPELNYYHPINSGGIDKKRGRVYKFSRDMFENIEWDFDGKDPEFLPF